MSELMRRSLEDAIRYAGGLKEALDQIFELRADGERAKGADLDRIEELIEDCAMHEALADECEER